VSCAGSACGGGGGSSSSSSSSSSSLGNDAYACLMVSKIGSTRKAACHSKNSSEAGMIGGARLMMMHARRRLSTCGSAAVGATEKAKRNILDLSFEDLAGEMVRLGQPQYRSRQLWTHIYSKLGTTFDGVPSFPASLKQQARAVPPQTPRLGLTPEPPQLQQEFVIGTGGKGDSEAVGCLSSDGTRKWKMTTVKGNWVGRQRFGALVAEERRPTSAWLLRAGKHRGIKTLQSESCRKAVWLRPCTSPRKNEARCASAVRSAAA
jgi:hypothetical protein